jgi:hypothetical protein
MKAPSCGFCGTWCGKKLSVRRTTSIEADISADWILSFGWDLGVACGVFRSWLPDRQGELAER